MKTPAFLALASLALSPGLMADEALPQVQAVEIVPQAKIAICRKAPNPSLAVNQIKEMEANEESIQSILNNEEAKTTIEKLNAAIILKSMEEANKHLTRASMEKITDLVDFEKQQLAIFAWQGSGQDLLSGHIAAGDGAATRFEYTPGMTKDLKAHSTIFAMPKDTNLAVVKSERRIMRCGVIDGGKLQVEPLQLNGKQLKLELKVQPAPEAE